MCGFSSKDSQLKFWDIASQSCFCTIADSVTEIYSFALLKQDRLLVVGSANMELEVYELCWLENGDAPEEEEDEDAKENEPVLKKKALIGAEAFQTEDDQGNVSLRKEFHVFRPSFGINGEET